MVACAAPAWRGSTTSHAAVNEPAWATCLLLASFSPPFSSARSSSSFSTPAQVLNGAIAAALFNLIYTYLLSQRIKWYAMCPWLDLINHRGTVEVRARGWRRAGLCMQRARRRPWHSMTLTMALSANLSLSTPCRCMCALRRPHRQGRVDGLGVPHGRPVWTFTRAATQNHHANGDCIRH